MKQDMHFNVDSENKAVPEIVEADKEAALTADVNNETEDSVDAEDMDIEYENLAIPEITFTHKPKNPENKPEEK